MSPVTLSTRGRRRAGAFGAAPPRACQEGWLHTLAFPVRTGLRRWRRLVGMILGVGLALGLAMTMMAMARASVDLLVGDYRASSANLYVHAEGGTLLPLLPGEGPGTIDHARNTLTQIRGVPGVETAFGALTWPVERERAGPKRRSDEPTEMISAVGIDGDPRPIAGSLLLKDGRWLRRSDEVVVGAKLAREKRLAIGELLRLDERDYTIVGIGRLRGVGLGSDGFAYLDARPLRQHADLGDVLDVIVVRTAATELVRARIPQLDSLTVDGPDDLVRQAEEVLRTALIMQSILIGLTLVIAGLFVANMLGRSVAARRLEFATLRAIGIGRSRIALIVAAEALFVTLAASVVGIAVSLLLGWLTNTLLAPIYGIESLYSASSGLFLNVVLLAAVLGLAAAALPAHRAIRVDPVEVLREA